MIGLPWIELLFIWSVSEAPVVLALGRWPDAVDCVLWKKLFCLTPLLMSDALSLAVERCMEALRPAL